LKEYALITGASKGIGEAFANQAAKAGYHLILVSLPNEGIQELSDALRTKYQVDILIYEADFTDSVNIQEFLVWLNDKKLRIKILINNAGMGMQGPFEELNPQLRTILMRLNMEALVNLTHGILPYLKASKGHILNMSSVAGFMPIPYKAVYCASKHFVLAFSNALHYELKVDDVKVTCVCPGPTITNEEVRARVETQGRKAKIMTLTAEEVAKEGFEAMLKGKREIVPGFNNRVIAFFMKILPVSWKSSFSGNMFRKHTDS
jgi:uncharacterized protein